MIIAVNPAAAVIPDDHGLVITPNGTVTIAVDLEHGCLRVYSETEPDAGDWDIACTYISHVGGQMAGAWAEGEVDVFQVSTPRSLYLKLAVGAASTVHSHMLSSISWRITRV
jgi:hypothetical protein